MDADLTHTLVKMNTMDRTIYMHRHTYKVTSFKKTLSLYQEDQDKE
jgi:hypothetical protein